MVSEARTQRLSLAVLIDAENAAASIANGLFDEIAKIGDANVRRIYGDFSKPNLKGWTEVIARYAINLRQNFAYTTGKNASDIELVIDAMDLLHSGRFDGFCLVSSDSDFTGLAKRIREQGVEVYGFGEQKTPESFRQACHRFIYTENLVVKPQAANQVATAAPALKPPGEAAALLKNVVAQMESEDGWVHLGQVGNVLSSMQPDFDQRTYGFHKLSDLIRATGEFDLNQPDGAGWRVRVKMPAKRGRTA